MSLSATAQQGSPTRVDDDQRIRRELVEAALRESIQKNELSVFNMLPKEGLRHTKGIAAARARRSPGPGKAA